MTQPNPTARPGRPSVWRTALPRLALFLAIAATLAGPVRAQSQGERNPAPDARLTYATLADGAELQIWVYKPPGWSPSDRRAAILFFFGGGWSGGNPSQFAPHAKHFADRGMVAMAAEYRIRSKHNSTPIDSTKDARSAMRWVIAQAGELGVDPARIAAGGGSAGGHLAATLPTIRDVNNAGDDLSIDPRPAALVLFNPAANLTGDVADLSDPSRHRSGLTVAEFATIDPIRHLDARFPPCIVFHGTADETVTFDKAEAFVEAVNAAGGGPCRLVAFEGRGHGFFNSSRGADDFGTTLRLSDDFLVEQGLLEPRAE
ncbi:MAG: alpha/beta hydrolase fold domain-containing protein [Alphaproteobacteria bacterium]|nr:alpha/beta hydrolase fold domain-containing protein [Alphaproteobacteria bacterium]